MFNVKDATFWLQMVSMGQLPWKAKVHILIMERCATLYTAEPELPWSQKAAWRQRPGASLPIFGSVWQPGSNREAFPSGLLLLALWNRTNGPFPIRCAFLRASQVWVPPHDTFSLLNPRRRYTMNVRIEGTPHVTRTLAWTPKLKPVLHTCVLVKKNPSSNKRTAVGLCWSLFGGELLIMTWFCIENCHLMWKTCFTSATDLKNNKTKHWKLYNFFLWIIKNNDCKLWKLMHRNLN